VVAVSQLAALRADKLQGSSVGAIAQGTNPDYLVSASTFPTAGSANPTLTILKLALRLADHLLDQKTMPSDVRSHADSISLSEAVAMSSASATRATSASSI
jgi:hypothetical protein